MGFRFRPGNFPGEPTIKFYTELMIVEEHSKTRIGVFLRCETVEEMKKYIGVLKQGWDLTDVDWLNRQHTGSINELYLPWACLCTT